MSSGISIKEFEFMKTKDHLTMSNVGHGTFIRYEFARRCEDLGIKMTIPRLLDYIDHMTRVYMRYTIEDEMADKPLEEWYPKGYKHE